LIGTGFPFRAGAHVDEYLAMLKVIMPSAAGVRRPGAHRWISPMSRPDASMAFGSSACPLGHRAGTLLI
jgi:hypothetical protein